jgi:hypothetical protein
MTEPLALEDGSRAVTWQHQGTGETRIVPFGTHPTEQPNYQPLQVIQDEADEIEETAVDRISAMLRMAGDADRADLKVYRIKEGQLEYCASYKPEQFEEGNFELLRRRFGAGDYEIRLYSADPVTRRFGVRNRTRLKIADDRGVPEESAGIPNAMNQVLGAIADGQRQMLEALVQMKQTPQKDPMEEMQKMFGMMTMMREAMGLNNQSQQKSSIGEIVDAIKELKAASSIIDNEKDEDDNPMKMLPQVLELVKAGVIQQPQAPQPMGAMIPPVALPPDMAAAQLMADPEPEQSEDDPQNLRGLLAQLLAHRGMENDIPAAAMYIYNEMPDDIVEIMFSSVWWIALSAAAPEVKPHKDWLQNVRMVAIELFNQAEQDEGEPQNIDEPPKAA